MSKTRSICGDVDKTVFYEISRGGYVKSVDEVTLPKYWVHLPSQNVFIVHIDLGEELNERGNGGYLDDYGDGARDFYDTMREV